jgi:hypothetical protein
MSFLDLCVENIVQYCRALRMKLRETIAIMAESVKLRRGTGARARSTERARRPW